MLMRSRQINRANSTLCLPLATYWGEGAGGEGRRDWLTWQEQPTKASASILVSHNVHCAESHWIVVASESEVTGSAVLTRVR